ncbi:unnamed protein product [Amoebophrya sp. A25]|nr:unnamed protein product [Amoebophrya sp. A25]|eukprot:GSA25T00018763001.1
MHAVEVLPQRDADAVAEFIEKPCGALAAKMKLLQESPCLYDWTRSCSACSPWSWCSFACPSTRRALGRTCLPRPGSFVLSAWLLVLWLACSSSNFLLVAALQETIFAEVGGSRTKLNVTLGAPEFRVHPGFMAANVTVSCRYLDTASLTLSLEGNTSLRVLRRGFADWLKQGLEESTSASDADRRKVHYGDLEVTLHREYAYHPAVKKEEEHDGNRHDREAAIATEAPHANPDGGMHENHNTSSTTTAVPRGRDTSTIGQETVGLSSSSTRTAKMDLPASDRSSSTSKREKATNNADASGHRQGSTGDQKRKELRSSATISVGAASLSPEVVKRLQCLPRDEDCRKQLSKILSETQITGDAKEDEKEENSASTFKSGSSSIGQGNRTAIDDDADESVTTRTDSADASDEEGDVGAVNTDDGPRSRRSGERRVKHDASEKMKTTMRNKDSDHDDSNNVWDPFGLTTVTLVSARELKVLTAGRVKVSYGLAPCTRYLTGRGRLDFSASNMLDGRDVTTLHGTGSKKGRTTQVLHGHNLEELLVIPLRVCDIILGASLNLEIEQVEAKSESRTVEIAIGSQTKSTRPFRAVCPVEIEEDEDASDAASASAAASSDSVADAPSSKSHATKGAGKDQPSSATDADAVLRRASSLSLLDFSEKGGDSNYAGFIPGLSQRTPPMAVGHSLTTVGPYLVHFGGRTDSGALSNQLWALSPSTLRWQNLDQTFGIWVAKPTARYGHAAAGTADGLLVVLGGRSEHDYLRDVWAIRLPSEEMNDASSSGNSGDGQENAGLLPATTSSATASARGAGHGLFRWRQFGEVPNRFRLSHFLSSVVLGQHRWLLCGGQAEDGTLSNEIWQVNLKPLLATFSSTRNDDEGDGRGVADAAAAPVLEHLFERLVEEGSGSRPRRRVGHSLSACNKRPLALLAAPLKDYAPAQAAQEAEETRESGSWGHAEEHDLGGVLLYGGLSESGGSIELLNDMWYFDYLWRTWFKIEHPAEKAPAVAFHSARLVGGRALVIVGGFSSSTSSGFIVSPDTWTINFSAATQDTTQEPSAGTRRDRKEDEDKVSSSSSETGKKNVEERLHKPSSSAKTAEASDGEDSQRDANHDLGSEGASTQKSQEEQQVSEEDEDSATSSSAAPKERSQSRAGTTSSNRDESTPARQLSAIGGESSSTAVRWRKLARGGPDNSFGGILSGTSSGDEVREEELRLDPLELQYRPPKVDSGRSWFPNPFASTSGDSGKDGSASSGTGGSFSSGQSSGSSSHGHVQYFEAANTLSGLGTVAVGATCYWPAVGRLVVHGGLTSAEPFRRWHTTAEETAVASGSGYVGVGSGAGYSLTPFLARECSFDPQSSKVSGPSSSLDLKPFLSTWTVIAPFSPVCEGSSSSDEDLGPCLPCDSGSVLTGGHGTGLSNAGLVSLPYTSGLRAPWATHQRQSPLDDRRGAQCLPCPAGTIAIDGTCLACPVGFHGPLRGMTDILMCIPCDGDTFSDSPGTASCEPCASTSSSSGGGSGSRNRDAASQTKNLKVVQQEREQLTSRRRVLFPSSSRSIISAVSSLHPSPTRVESQSTQVDKRKLLSARHIKRNERIRAKHITGIIFSNQCPLMASNPFQKQSVGRVREQNAPHGDPSLQTHAWWQRVTLAVGVSVTSFLVLVLLLVHVKIPRRTARLLRRVDMRPITGSIVPSEQGGIIFLMYAIVAVCVLFFMLARHHFGNRVLTSMAIPGEEEVGRGVDEIKANFRVTAVLDGYVGPCVAGDRGAFAQAFSDVASSSEGAVTKVGSSAGGDTKNAGATTTSAFENDGGRSIDEGDHGLQGNEAKMEQMQRARRRLESFSSAASEEHGSLHLKDQDSHIYASADALADGRSIDILDSSEGVSSVAASGRRLSGSSTSTDEDFTTSSSDHGSSSTREDTTSTDTSNSPSTTQASSSWIISDACHSGIHVAVEGFSSEYGVRCAQVAPQQCSVEMFCPSCTIDVEGNRLAKMWVDVDFSEASRNSLAAFTAAREIRWSLSIRWLEHRKSEERQEADAWSAISAIEGGSASSADEVDKGLQSDGGAMGRSDSENGAASGSTSGHHSWNGQNGEDAGSQAASSDRGSSRTASTSSQRLRTEAFSRVDVSVAPAGNDRALRGAAPSRVRIALVPTDYRDLIQNLQLFGFVAQFVGQTERGSFVSSGSAFYEKPPVVRSEMVLDVSHTGYKLVLSRKRTFFDVCSMLLGFLSGMSLIARVVTAIWTQHHRLWGVNAICGARNPFLYYLAVVCCFWLKDLDYDDDEVLTLAPDSPHSFHPSKSPGILSLGSHPVESLDLKSALKHQHSGPSGSLQLQPPTPIILEREQVWPLVRSPVGFKTLSKLRRVPPASLFCPGGGYHYQALPVSFSKDTPGGTTTPSRMEMGLTPRIDQLQHSKGAPSSRDQTARRKDASLVSDGDFVW